jgi:hypothetical protein
VPSASCYAQLLVIQGSLCPPDTLRPWLPPCNACVLSICSRPLHVHGHAAGQALRHSLTCLLQNMLQNDSMSANTCCSCLGELLPHV